MSCITEVPKVTEVIQKVHRLSKYNLVLRGHKFKHKNVPPLNIEKKKRQKLHKKENKTQRLSKINKNKFRF